MQTKRQATSLINRSREGLWEVDEQSPDGVDQQDDYADGIGNAMALCEGVSEATRSSDVFLKQVTPYEQAYYNTNKAILHSMGKKGRGCHNQKYQSPLAFLANLHQHNDCHTYFASFNFLLISYLVIFIKIQEHLCGRCCPCKVGPTSNSIIWSELSFSRVHGVEYP